MHTGDLTLGALRMLSQVGKPHLIFVLKPIDGGYGLWFDLSRNFGHSISGWLIAERSKKIRVFGHAETAFGVARQLGLRELRVEIKSPEQTICIFNAAHSR